MPQWQLSLTEEAEDDLTKISSSIRQRILEKTVWLKDNFDQTSHLPLGFNWKGFYKLRVGDWRIIYEFETSKLEITVHRIENRDKIYKKRK